MYSTVLEASMNWFEAIEKRAQVQHAWMDYP